MKTKEIVETTLPDLLGFRSALKSMKPSTKEEAIKLVHFLSDISSAEKDLKAAAYAFLDNRCADGCEEHEVDGLKVIKVQNQMKKYKVTKEVKEAEKDLEAAKEALQAAKDRAGFTLTDGASYWKAVR